MSGQPEITQRDLRMRSKEIMDAVERGQAFTVTRDGHRIGELVPLRQRRRFVSRAEFAAMSRTAPVIDADAFRARRVELPSSTIASRLSRQPARYSALPLASPPPPVQIHPVPGKILHPAREGGTRARYQASLDDQWRARGDGAC